jgi:putative membrane protein
MLTSAIRLVGAVPVASICLYRFVTLALNTLGWKLLLAPGDRPGFPTLFRLRWIGESVNNLLPVAQVGGDVARASLVQARGVPRAQAVGAMIADLGTGIVTQMVFGVAGALALGEIVPQHAQGPSGVWSEIVSGMAIAALAVVGLSILFHFGAMRVAARWFASSRARERWGQLAGGLTRLDDALTSLFARQGALAGSFGWHLLAWVSQVGETWLLLSFFGSPIKLGAAFAIESLTSAARGAAFFVPSGVGVQEVTIISMSRLVGVDMELAIALGIAKRARELVMGVPGLLTWLFDKRWWRRLRKVQVEHGSSDE